MLNYIVQTETKCQRRGKVNSQSANVNEEVKSIVNHQMSTKK